MLVVALTWAAFAPGAWALPDTTINGPSGFVNSNSATFTFGATGATTGLRFECSFDGAPFDSCSSPQMFNSLSEAAHSFQARAIDASGTDPTPAARDWTVDQTPPDTNLTNGPSGPSGTTASWEFTSTQANSTFACSLDGAAFASCTSPNNYTGLTQGLHIIQVKATDPAGNTDSSAAIGVWTADATAPDTVITSAPSGTVNATTVAIDFASTEPGATFICSLDGAVPAACTSASQLDGLGDGSHTFGVQAIDAFGNLDPTPATASWTVDASPPDTTITTKPGGVTNQKTASFAFTSNDPGVTFECRLDGGAFGSCTPTKDYAALAEGNHTFQVRALDAAGPDPTPAAFGWKVDITPPSPPAVDVEPAAPGRGSVRAAANTNLPPIAQNDPAVAGNAFAPLVTPFTLAHHVRVSWSSTDPGGGPIASYDLDYFRSEVIASVSVEFYTPHQLTSHSTATEVAQFPVAAGRTYCFWGRATDQAGNVSELAPFKCTMIPLKASSMTHASGFKKKTGSGYYAGQYSEATSGLLKYELERSFHGGGWFDTGLHGAILAKRVALIATKCPSCGKVRVSLRMSNGAADGDEWSPVERTKVIDLKATSTKKSQKISLWTFGPEALWKERLRLKIEVLSSGKPVRIEGIGVLPI